MRSKRVVGKIYQLRELLILVASQSHLSVSASLKESLKVLLGVLRVLYILLHVCISSFFLCLVRLFRNRSFQVRTLPRSLHS